MRQDKDEAFLGKKLKLVELLMLSQDRDANDKVLARRSNSCTKGLGMRALAAL